MSAELIVVGTRQHYGVGGCMCDELAQRGYGVVFVDLHPEWTTSICYRAVARVMGSTSPHARFGNAQLVRVVEKSFVPYAIVTNGRELNPETVAAVRSALERRGGGIACFLCDDPFNPAHRTDSWLAALVEYSLVVSTKRQVVPDLERLGCRCVRYARFGYHPAIHRPVDPQALGFEACDVAIAGTADQDRLPIIGELAARATELSFGVYGHGWGAHPALRKLARRRVVGLHYAAAMRAATTCPCLVRRSNRDGHVLRSIELPAMGAFMLAERTEEHQEIFEEGVHCDYWGSVDELVDKSRWYARNPRRAAEIALAGHKLITTNPHTYADRALEVLEMLGRPASAR